MHSRRTPSRVAFHSPAVADLASAALPLLRTLSLRPACRFGGSGGGPHTLACAALRCWPIESPDRPWAELKHLVLRFGTLVR